MLRRFWKALKPEEQFTEGSHDRTIQVRMIKLVPGVFLRLRRIPFLPVKVTLGAEIGCPVRNSLNIQE